VSPMKKDISVFVLFSLKGMDEGRIPETGESPQVPGMLGSKGVYEAGSTGLIRSS
jgi:hypothetical protein